MALFPCLLNRGNCALRKLSACLLCWLSCRCEFVLLLQSLPPSTPVATVLSHFCGSVKCLRGRCKMQSRTAKHHLYGRSMNVQHPPRRVLGFSALFYSDAVRSWEVKVRVGRRKVWGPALFSLLLQGREMQTYTKVMDKVKKTAWWLRGQTWCPSFFVSTVGHWNRFPRAIGGCPIAWSAQGQDRFNGALSNLVWCKVSLPMAKGWN